MANVLDFEELFQTQDFGTILATIGLYLEVAGRELTGAPIEVEEGESDEDK